ncbi:MAG: hypothetical protein WC916_04915 [Candidatus Woesearchaeota archaeon]
MNKKNRTKGQAAIEFMVTYGWAILGVMVAIGALVYFGIFNPAKYLNDQCNFGDQLKCEDFVMSTNGTTGNGIVAVQLRNNFGVTINISATGSSVLIEETNYTGDVVSCSGITPQTNSCDLKPGAKGYYYFNVSNLIKDDKIKVQATIAFSKAGAGNPAHKQVGTIYGTVTDKYLN